VGRKEKKSVERLPFIGLPLSPWAGNFAKSLPKREWEVIEAPYHVTGVRNTHMLGYCCPEVSIHVCGCYRHSEVTTEVILEDAVERSDNA
jgi:hypothetical protein